MGWLSAQCGEVCESFGSQFGCQQPLVVVRTKSPFTQQHAANSELNGLHEGRARGTRTLTPGCPEADFKSLDRENAEFFSTHVALRCKHAAELRFRMSSVLGRQIKKLSHICRASCRVTGYPYSSSRW